MLADILPPDRRHLARRAWPAIERAHPGLPGVVCELAAELAEAAGAPEAAADRSTESARRALGGGALVTAEATARRARRLAPTGGRTGDAVAELLVGILVTELALVDWGRGNRGRCGRPASSPSATAPSSPWP